MLMFIKYIMNISPNLLNWTSELNQLDVVSRISISDLFKRIEYVKSSLTFLIHYFKTTEKVNSSINSGSSVNNNNNNHNHDNDKITNPIHLTLNNLTLMNRLLELLTKTSETIWCILYSTAYWIKASSPLSSQSTDCNIMLLLDDNWLSPLARFASAFKNCVYEFDRKSRHSQNTTTTTTSTATTDNNHNPVQDTHSACSSSSFNHSHHHHHHRHSQRQLKEQEKIPPPSSSSSSKRETRHRKPRTRQLDTDGLMDDILHSKFFKVHTFEVQF
ncbi:unnamed protein product [Schistosoma turkestanicum]|nr:unnamed protein product [Schistosoma turkestanicum]